MAYSIIPKNCTGCSACAKSCPVGAIQGIFLKNYSIDEKLCIECGLCGMICPEKAVLDPKGKICERIPRDERLRPTVDSDLCTACKTCVAICPFQCRDTSEEGLIGKKARLFSPGLCVACGECKRACAKKSIELQDKLSEQKEEKSGRE